MKKIISTALFAPRMRASVLMITAMAFLAQGCIRYVPSREELEKKYGRDGEDRIAGQQEFDAYETELKKRLEALVASRQHLLTQDPTETGYQVGAGDILTIDVYGFADLRSESEVTPAGTVALPLIGESHIGGMSLAKAREQLTREYSRFIRSPNVQLGVKNYQASRVSVIGEVAKPGVYPLKRSGQLLTELLSEAGGRTERASGRILLLPAPRSAGSAQVMNVSTAGQPALPQVMGVEIDLDQLIGRIDQRPLLVPLLPGDTIVVPEVGKYEVDGEVSKPGSFNLASRTTAMGAVAAAGGFTYSASVNKVEVIREIGDGKKALLTLDLEEVGLRGGRDIRLRDGDIVRVPSEPGLFFKRQIVEALNGVFRGVGVSGRM